MKIAINKCYGGFSISKKCLDRMIELGYVEEKPSIKDDTDRLYYASQDRTNPLMIQAIEELGEAANGQYAKIKIVEIPDKVQYEISEYDGIESIEAPRQFYG